MAIKYYSGINISGSIVPSADSTFNLGGPAFYFSNVYADTYYGDGSNLTGLTVDEATSANTALALTVTVKNISGGSLSKGTVVHAAPSATPPSGNVIEVIAADYDTASSMPGLGVLNETLADDAEGEAIMFGAISGIDTSSFIIGAELYVGNNGALTVTKPTGTDQLIQKIGVVIKSHATNGLIKVFGAGRTNDVPNEIDRTIRFDANQRFTDNSLILMGGGDMFQIGHKASYSQIATYEGNLYIDNNANDFDIVFRSDDGNGGLATYYYLDGSEGLNRFSKNILLSDDVSLSLGNGFDLKLLHNGTASYIDNSTGNITIRNLADDSDVIISSDNGSGGTTQYFRADGGNGTVKLYQYGNLRFETTSTGSKVTGDLEVTGNFTVSGTTTFIDTTHLNVGDNIITLNADLSSSTAPTENAGISVYRGSSSSVSFEWDETNDIWTLGDQGLVADNLNITKENAAPTLNLLKGGNNPSTNELIGRLNFQTDYSGSPQDWARINVETNSSSVRTDMDFYVKSTSGALQTALRLQGGSSTPKAFFYNDVDVDGGVTVSNILTVENVDGDGVGYVQIGTVDNDAGNGYVRGNILIGRDQDQVTWDSTNDEWTYTGGGSSDFSMLISDASAFRIFIGDAVTSGTTYTNQEFKDAFQALAIGHGGNVNVYRGELQMGGSTAITDTRIFTSNSTASNSVPKYTFAGDTDTGLGYIGTNSVGLIAQGSRKFYINNTDAYFQNLSGAVNISSDLIVSGDITGNSFIKSGGTSSQFLKADGSVDSNTYALSSHTHNDFAPVKRGSVTISKDSYTRVARVEGNNLASTIRMTVHGTTGNIVVNCLSDISVNHSADIIVHSQAGNYSSLDIKIISDNNEDFDIYLQYTGSSSAGTSFTAAIEIFPLNNETITYSPTATAYSGTTFIHTATPGQIKWGQSGQTPNIYLGSNKVYHAGNDGAGSGLDADLLDGQHASYFINTSNIGSQSVSYATNAGTLDGIDSGSFLRSDANDSYSGEITASGTGWYLWSLGSRGASSGNYGIGNRNDNAYRQLTFHVPNQAAYSSSGTIPSFGWYSNGAVQLMKLDSDSGNLWVKGQTGTNTPNGFRIDSSSYARIELDSNNNWSYVRLMDNGVTTWDIACYDSGNLEWRPGGSQTNRMTLDNGGRLRSNEFWAQTSTNSSRFTGAGDWGVRHYTSSGYIQLGPANTGHAHIYTDRSNFYFNKQIQLLGVSQINQNDIRTKIYYDWDDTNYYVDPAGGSLLSTLVLGGSQTRGTYTTASQYHSGADNLILKGNSSGISTIFFESEKDGTNINHPSDFGFIQFHPYGTGTSGEANELIIGVSNDADDHVVLNAPSINGLIFRSGASNTDYTVWHSGNDSAFIKTSNIGSQSVNYANSAGTANSVTWSNVSSKPAAWLNHAVLIEDKAPGATAFPSGFYQNYNGSGNPTGTWFNYINVRHSNTGNGHGYQLGMSYYDNNLWFRSYQGGTSPTFQSWETAIGSGSSNQTKTGYFQSNSSLRAPIFYDSNNTGYYCDPASSSYLYNLNLIGAKHTYLQINPGNGYEAMVRYIGGSGSSFYVGKRTSTQLIGSTDAYHVYSETTGQTVGGYDSSGHHYAVGSSRAPVFYDLNNTGYYVDPSSTNVCFRGDGEFSVSNVYTGSMQRGALNIGRTDTNYRWDGTTWASDVRVGILANCADHWEFAVHDSGESVESVFYYNSGDNMIYMGRDIGWGTTPIVGVHSFRAPIFYDYNNTGYYLDPASTSYLNTVSLGAQTWRGTITWNGGVNINVSGESSFDMYSGGQFGVWNSSTQTWSIRAPWEGQVEIGQAGTRGLKVYGTMTATADVVAYSDIRTKENVKTIDNALEKVTNLRGVEYNRIGEADKKIGVIAQEIEKILPEVVTEDKDGMKAVSYGNIVGVLIEAIKEQQQQIDELKKLINP